MEGGWRVCLKTFTFLRGVPLPERHVVRRLLYALGNRRHHALPKVTERTGASGHIWQRRLQECS